MKGLPKESMLKIRDSLPKKDILERSRKIKDSLFGLKEYANSRTIMFFVSFNSEVDTHEMLKEALKNKVVVVPKVVHHEIEPSIIIDFDNLISGKFGILEPIDLMRTSYKNIGLVLVPGIVFDKEGHRIGYGYGYYDRFLAKVPKAVKIGLAFDFQIVDKIPKEAHDVPVDFIVTEKKVINCRHS
jgi:5-formyltetrahydrofolate cyclo-ligase